jgi:hypothetical protein
VGLAAAAGGPQEGALGPAEPPSARLAAAASGGGAKGSRAAVKAAAARALCSRGTGLPAPGDMFSPATSCCSARWDVSPTPACHPPGVGAAEPPVAAAEEGAA